MADLSTQTPVQIDTELARLFQEKAKAEALVAGYVQTKARALEARDFDRAHALETYIQGGYHAINGVNSLIRPLQDEFVRRGCWTRFWLVTNSNGHVHHTTNCTTTYAGTQFAWLTQFSGTSHEDLVELAGEKACTVCFPNAPVDVLKRPSKLTTPERQAREAEKAHKAAAKAASEVVVENYTDGGFSRAKTHTFKTVRGATNAIASTLSSLTWYGTTHPSAPQWLSDIAEVRKALAAKGVEYDYDKALAAARKKTVKEGGVAKY